MSWSVFSTHRQAEQWACDNLARLGYPAYCPLTSVYRGGRSPLRTLVPLFSRYAFVEIADNQPWVAVRYAPGVRDLLTNGDGRPAHVRHGTVEELQATEDARHKHVRAESTWQPGAAASVARGPFHGHEAVVLTVGNNRARIGLVVFGAMREVWTELSNLMPR